MNPESAIHAIHQQLPRAADLVNGLSADEANWKPAEGSWSIAECIAHMNVLNDLYARAIQEAIAAAKPLDRPSDTYPKLGWLERLLLWTIEPPYRLKFKAPSKFQPAASRFDLGELLTEWTATHERLTELARTANLVDLTKTKVLSPATPLFKPTLLCSLLIPPAHDRRHLWQGGKVRLILEHTTRSAGLR